MRFFFLALILLSLSGCQQLSKGQRDFLKLQEAAISCQSRPSKDKQCQQTIEKYLLMAEAAQRLQTNPQQFGQEILALQMRLSILEKKSSDDVAKVKSELKRLIELVAIFESP